MTDDLAQPRAALGRARAHVHEQAWILEPSELAVDLLRRGIRVDQLHELLLEAHVIAAAEAEPKATLTAARPVWSHLRDHERQAADFAREALHFRAGFKDAGGAPEHVHRVGRLADTVLEDASKIDALRSLVGALAERVEAQDRIIAGRAGAALKATSDVTRRFR